MTSTELSITPVQWYQQAYDCLIKGKYSQAESFWEQAVEAEPDVKSHYWHLGLALLLQEREVEAQTTWMLGMAEGEPEQIEQWTAELIQVLQTEAERRQALSDYQVAWAIRQHWREINPAEINNLLHLIQLGIALETLSGEELTELGLIELLKSEPTIELDLPLLLQTLQSILDFAPQHPLVLDFAEACFPYIGESQAANEILGPAAVKVGTSGRASAAVRLLELGLRLEPNNPTLLLYLAGFYQNLSNYSQGIETAKLCYSLVKTLPGKIAASNSLLRGLMNAVGYWEEACSILQEQEAFQLSITEAPWESIEEGTVLRLVNSTYFRPYFQDNPQNNREIQNRIVGFCYTQIQANFSELAERYRQRKPPIKTKLKKIGYLSHCLRRHSVGWLARGLFQHHDRSQFEIYGYFINYLHAVHDPIQEWYVNHVDRAHKFGVKASEIAEAIYQDEIDVLIDLDSITLDVSCEVIALKPAPIQATWLGLDASGMPSIDYFIADSYVLPDNAQNYYREKIWRLPQTYIAVDGFEVGIPTLRRDQLGIPNDAVVYLSAQRGYKRHPETTRLQMKIIKEVPNSYFLIKGLADSESNQNFFTQIAEQEGVDAGRLRFLDQDASEAVHRANLRVADVVLDTYPYNGATTTLETLWMGIPLVTRVGEQFAARNSYTMMVNAGITEGIAWTDEEYVEWGARLGKDPALRQKIAWQLQQSRQTAPLWNAKQFAREMESAYEQMWAIHLENSKF